MSEGNTQFNSETKKAVFLRWFLPQIILMLIVGGATFAYYYLYSLCIYDVVYVGVLSELAICILSYAIRKNFPINTDKIEDSYSKLNFSWIFIVVGVLLAILCRFIPNTIWPFTGFFVILSLYAGSFIGIVSGIAIVAIAMLFSMDTFVCFVIYIFAGLIAILFFNPFEIENKNIIKKSLFTIFALGVMISVGIFLSNPSEITLELIAFPIANILLTFILTLVCVFNYRDRYIYQVDESIYQEDVYDDIQNKKIKFDSNELPEDIIEQSEDINEYNETQDEQRYNILNNTKYKILSHARETDRKNYKYAIHTAYFCEKIADLIGLNTELMKCLAYYYRFCPITNPKREIFIEENDFPEEARDVFIEYTDFIAKKDDAKIYSKECVVLLCTQMVVATSVAMIERDPDIDITEQVDRLVDAAFSKYEKFDTFVNSNISLSEISSMKQLFKEEKLYYDFLR